VPIRYFLWDLSEFLLGAGTLLRGTRPDRRSR
jgi:hypothetical protein